MVIVNMASNCSCNTKHQKAHFLGCGCGTKKGELPPFIGQMPSGSPLPDAEVLSNLSNDLVEELAAALEPGDLLELCRREPRIRDYCSANEKYRKQMSKKAIDEADEDMLKDFYQPQYANVDMLMVAVTNGDDRM